MSSEVKPATAGDARFAIWHLAFGARDTSLRSSHQRMSTKPDSGFRNFVTSFTDMLRCPRALWFVIGAFVLDSTAYFGVLTLMTSYLSTDLAWGDKWAGVTVSVFTMLVTLFILGPAGFAAGFAL